LILYGTGWDGGAVLAAFFISSNLVSRTGRAVAPLDAKSDRRDAWQVFANGGVATVAAVTAPLELRLWVVTAALAAAAADTWATAVGIRSGKVPRLLGIGRRVATGTSGGMSVIGTAGGVIGALVVSATGALVSGRLVLLPAGILIGFVGMLMDSGLGALLQGRFHCTECDEPSEWRVHRCGGRTVLKGGLGWLDNDVVNFSATLFAAGAALLCWRWLD
jgi:uncharacterized protein (TIGR00297 family)